MTIENNLNRIADALEGILGKLSHIDAAVKPEVKKPATVVETSTSVAPVATPPKPAQAATVPSAPVTVTTPHIPAAPAAPTTTAEVAVPPVEVTMTPEELNAALVVEFGRLKSRDPIDAVMREMSVSSIHDLKPEQYDELLTKVRAL